ncbi:MULTISPECIES: FAD-binding oxidoreductase [unclassified Chelatococcus]|uniref:FAD-binding oxidoreductase n=1 Tax=unclassified Chelatococcus TaxID=2638111 RepID=UPI001BCB8DFA|nr:MULTISPECIES: FAD-binding oxidoreductase [unclassified Chelatococcus]CAH1671300.1 FAD/FMN-containing dehydrogenase [Hyphomicrobiales bacterium]MBS7738445.1 FAD-binding oxidoreductase [Chelatococcus sp. HY11]MBX3542849.1 FAD-binding oxidoreductase [Chelatococcus sp.]MCO5077025.1 FAD-binding oxidoreductase [Chelatococcus sp.]CAH1676490.1 FAD/FMN-containing dehydrogenase [Hyphomicrobiales bacterium]
MAVDKLGALTNVLDPAAILVADDDMAPYLADWRGRYVGRAQAVLRPRSVEQVSAVLRWASETRTPVFPQGGNTGLAGGATPDEGGTGIVLALGRLNRILDIDTAGNTMVVEAGAILADVQRAADDAERLFPMSLGSEGSCQIGGIIATNAGGINVIRYGTTRELVLGLDYVLADGTIVRGLKRLPKNNTGYDLRHLLIGSEGTLAVITAAALKLFPRPTASASAFCAVSSPQKAVDLLSLLRQRLVGRISSFELMCDGEMGFVLDGDVGGDLRLPVAERAPWYVFIEVADSGEEAVLVEMLTAALGEAFERDYVLDAAIAQSEGQAKAIWHLRFAVSEANRRAGPNVSHDTSVATADVPAFLAEVSTTLADRFPSVRPLFVGHVGDGNIHVIALFPHDSFADRAAFETAASAVNDCIFGVVDRFHGSISAEHGIGRSLARRLPDHTDKAAYRLMNGIKQLYDPLGILNPGKVLLRG